MGTNYYAAGEATCDNPDHTKPLHIGKSSGGWKFGFHAIPDHEPPLTSWTAWREYLQTHAITDEYGTNVSIEEFIQTVENRWKPTGRAKPMCRVEQRFPGDRDFHDADGFDFSIGEFS